jgi:aminopeptidase
VTPEERLQRYAELTVRIGANVQAGQPVGIWAYIEHAPVARAIAAEAYRAGARTVHVHYRDQHIRKAAIEHGPAEELGKTPQHVLDWITNLDDGPWVFIQLAGDPDPTLLKGLDQERVAASEPIDFRRAWVPHVRDRTLNWTIVSAPSEGWVRAIFGEPDLERLWAAVATATRLDEPDPVAAWRDHFARLQARAEALNERRLDAVRYRGPGTDLTVGLLERSRWMCATLTTRDGVVHAPNLPTEEVFTSPDWRRADGVVRYTYPLSVGGSVVRDLEVRFEDGRIVEASASEGESIVHAQLETDEQARYLGELALVDRTSAVSKSGIVFQDTLFDENASSHIAYGNGLPWAVEGADGKTPEELLALGVNMSGAHTDFMVGGPEVEIDGLTRSGEAVPLLRGDVFQLTD